MGRQGPCQGYWPLHWTEEILRLQQFGEMKIGSEVRGNLSSVWDIGVCDAYWTQVTSLIRSGYSLKEL